MMHCHCGWSDTVQMLNASPFVICPRCTARVVNGPTDKPRWRWEKWAGRSDGTPTMWTRTIFAWCGYVICVHKMVATDAETCFHSHPAFAVRVILRGGYYEELRDSWVTKRTRALRLLRPLSISLVRPEFWHRIHKLYAGDSYSLWIRFPKTHDIEIEGKC